MLRPQWTLFVCERCRSVQALDGTNPNEWPVAPDFDGVFRCPNGTHAPTPLRRVEVGAVRWHPAVPPPRDPGHPSGPSGATRKN